MRKGSEERKRRERVKSREVRDKVEWGVFQKTLNSRARSGG